MDALDPLIDDVIKREGAKDTNNPNDSGGRTRYGISEKWNPEAWQHGPPTLADARAFYRRKYIEAVGFDRVQPAYLQAQLVDFGILSGPHVAIAHLQKVLGVTADGVLGPLTLTALAARDPRSVNNHLVDARVLMIARLVQRRPKDLVFLFGWLTRALSFRMD